MTLALLALVPLSFQAPAVDDAASLVPADAALLVRIESLNGLAELAQAFSELEPGQEPPSAAELLAGFAYPGPAANVDAARPLFLALSFRPDSPAPGLTWIVAAASGSTLALDNSESALTLHTQGDYTAITNQPGAPRPSAASPLVAALPPGLVALHVDLAGLIQRFRPLIDMGLREAELQMANMPQQASMPFDMEGLFEWYFDRAHEIVDSAEALELGLAHDGRTLALRGTYRVKAGSPQVFAPLETTALAPFAGLIDPDAPLQMASNGRWTDLLAPMSGMMEVALEMYPEPFRSDMERALDLQRALADTYLPGFAMGADFTTEGVRMSYVLRAKDPARVLASFEEMFRFFDREDGLMSVGAAERLLVEGLEGRVFPLEIKPENMAKLFSTLGGDPLVAEEASRAAQQAVETLYGRNLRCGIAARGELVAMVLGNNDSVLRAELERLVRPALPAAEMLALSDELPPGAFGLAYRFDFGRTMARMMTAMQGFPNLPFGVWPEQPFSLDMWAAALEREYSGGMRLDLDELVEFARSIRELEGK